MTKELRALIKRWVRRGWSWKMGGVHGKLIHPSGHSVTVSVSPSCPFVVRKIEGDCRRLERKITMQQVPVTKMKANG